MKKLIFAAVAIFLVVGGGAAAVRHYNNYQSNKGPTVEQVTQEKDALIAKIQAETKATVKKWEKVYQNERIECEKGQAAYDRLTPFGQTQTPDPKCGPAVVE